LKQEYATLLVAGSTIWRTAAPRSRSGSPESVALLKDRIAQQVPPIVHQLATLRPPDSTRKPDRQPIKREVDEYYQHLSLSKKSSSHVNAFIAK